VQRGGPSTGLPTKTEQSDLFQAVYGRNGESPMPVIAARSPSDVFDTVIEACAIRVVETRTPVILLSDGAIANGTEPWPLPDVKQAAAHRARFNHRPHELPRLRARPADAGAAVGEAGNSGPRAPHRRLEKDALTGNISYDPHNHETMVRTRNEKVMRLQERYAPTEVYGDAAATCW